MKALAALLCEIRKRIFSFGKIPPKHIAYAVASVSNLPMSVHLTESENAFQANKMSLQFLASLESYNFI